MEDWQRHAFFDPGEEDIADLMTEKVRGDVRIAPLKGIFRALEKIGVDNGTEIWTGGRCATLLGGRWCAKIWRIYVSPRKSF